ncbi:MAG TPA: hypothetical protein VK184_04060 [Nostocaceae cyanobacterium]|nr:hypothetical protein [Nostocaceae cyanobacterium]
MAHPTNSRTTNPNSGSSSPLANKKLGKSSEILVIKILELIDQILYRLMGQLGRTVYTSIQDAIALSIILLIPNLIAKFFLGKDFSNFQACLLESPWSANRYACFLIVTSDFLLWIIIVGRIIARFWADLKTVKKQK